LLLLLLLLLLFNIIVTIIIIIIIIIITIIIIIIIVIIIIINISVVTTISIVITHLCSNFFPHRTNSIPVTYYNNFAGKFADSRTGSFSSTSGELTVSSPSVVGIYAYSTQSSFVNTWALDGTVSADSMSVVATYNTGRPYLAYADMNVMPSSCTSANNAVFSSSATLSGCAVTLAANSGGSSVAITASYMSFSSAVAYRAYYFMAYELNATRVLLRKLGCGYETAWLSAFGELTLDGVYSLSTIDISNMVNFASSNTSVVGVLGRVASGVAVGSVNLMFGTGPGVATRTITVSDSVASVLQLVSFAFSSTTVTPLFILNTEFSMATITVQPWLSLTAEQHTAAVVSYAQNDDGVWTDVSRYSSLTLTSTVADDLTVNKVGMDWQLSVPVGASSVTAATPVISGSLTDSCSLTTLTTAGYGYASSNLSVPIAIVVTASSPLLARPGTPAATILGIITSVQLTVTVTFLSSLGVLSYRGAV
jgi:hypothetical protein